VNGGSGNDAIHIIQGVNGTTSVEGASILVASGRTMYYSTSVSTSQVPYVNVYGNDGNDTIRIETQPWAPTSLVYAYGGAGNDTLIGGGGTDLLYGGDGSDTLITIGAGADRVEGDGGVDSFWVDGNDTVADADLWSETVPGTVHRMASFDGTAIHYANGTIESEPPSNGLYGLNLHDPVITAAGGHYASFRGCPLFASDGPKPEDVRQGVANDCSFLATLVGLAVKDPNRIRQMIVDLGDGSYAVTFRVGGQDHYIRIDADLPVNAAGKPIYANQGHGNSLWVPLLEKAWTFMRPTHNPSWDSQYLGTYGEIEGGGPNELWGAVGVSYRSNGLSGTLGDWLSGKEVVVLTHPTTVSAGSNLIPKHYYYVDSINYVYYGGVPLISSLTLRNPHGGSSGVDAEFVTISASQFYASFIGEAAAYV
jgi:hypothetical protein